MSANGVINGLGGRVQKELGRFEVKGIGNITFWHKIQCSHEE
jgi:5-methylcytosine-specific restriction protein A